MAEHIVQLQRRRDTAANWTADDTSTFNGAPNATASNFGVMGYEP
jgi:hypothetical protein